MSIQARSGNLPTSPYAIGFATQTKEILGEFLHVNGRLPEWLYGRLIRTVPCLYEAGQTNLRHWFDGLAMLYSFEFAESKIRCQSRILHSQAYENSLRLNRLATAEFATNPRLSFPEKLKAIFAPPLTDNGNVNIVRIGDRFVALTEIPKWVAFNPANLETLPRFKSKDGLRLTTSTAHPHFDAAGKTLINVGTHLGPRSSYVVYEIAADGCKRLIASIPVERPGYIHSFAVTQKYVIVLESPLLLNSIDLLLSGKPYIENFHWFPKESARIIGVDREQHKLSFEIPAPAAFLFHHVNAFEQNGGNIVMDVLTYSDAGIIQSLYLNELRSSRPVPSARLTRYIINPSTQSVQQSRLDDSGLELPRINEDKSAGRDYRYVWCAGSTADTNFLDHLIKLDLQDNMQQRWMSEGTYPGEPIFVPRRGAHDEDEGVVLSLVLDTSTKNSFLLVLDAKSMNELARAHLPVCVPFGFHGQYWSMEGDS